MVTGKSYHAFINFYEIRQFLDGLKWFKNSETLPSTGKKEFQRLR